MKFLSDDVINRRGSTGSLASTTIGEIILLQAPTVHGWVCPTCRHHRGNLNCTKGVFIAVVGGNLSGCTFFEVERRNRRQP